MSAVMFETPPQNLEAEQSVLGACILDRRALEECAAILTSRLFYREAHQAIFDAYVAVMESGRPVDLVTTVEHLRSKGLLDRVGGVAYLAQLADIVPTTANAAYYAAIVHDKARRRALLAFSREAESLARDEAIPTAEMLDRAREHFLRLSERSTADMPPLSIAELFALADQAGNIRWLLPNGIARGFVHIISAPPKSGKTWFGLTLARAVCAGTDWAGVEGVEQGSVLWVDEEMGAQLLVERLRKLEFTPDLPFFTLCLNRVRLDDARDVEAIAKEARARNVSLIVIDSFRRVHQKNENDNSEMKLLMSPLKDLAATGAAVVVLHHDRKRTNFDTSEQEMSSGAMDVIAQVDMVFGMKRDKNTFTMTCRAARLVGETKAPVVSFRLEDVDEHHVAVVPVAQSDLKQEKQTLVETAILHYLEENPGANTRAIIAAVGVKRDDVVATLKQLTEKGRLLAEVGGPGKPNRYYLVDADEPEYTPLDL